MLPLFLMTMYYSSIARSGLLAWRQGEMVTGQQSAACSGIALCPGLSMVLPAKYRFPELIDRGCMSCDGIAFDAGFRGG